MHERRVGIVTDERSVAFVFPLDLENYERTRDASTLNPGDVIVYNNDHRRRYIREAQRTWLCRVTRTEGQNIYVHDVYPRDGWPADQEFEIVSGQVDHHGVYVIRRAEQ